MRNSRKFGMTVLAILILSLTSVSALQFTTRVNPWTGQPDFYTFYNGSDNISVKCLNLSGTQQCSWPSGTGAGWTTSGNYVYNDTAAALVGIGIATPASKLHVVGTGATLNVSNATSSHLFVNGTSGSIGIGTVSPTAALEVVGTTKITSGALSVGGGTRINSNGQILAASGTAADAGLRFNADASGIYLPAANTLGFVTNNTEKMRLDSSGRVGIGAMNPVAWLEINQSNQSIYGLRLEAANAGPTSGVLVIRNTPGSGGNIPAILTVRGAAGVLQLGYNTATGSNARMELDGGDNSNNANIKIYDDAGALTVFLSGSTSYSNYINNGNVGIGTTSPTSSLTINSSSGYGGLEVTNSTGSSRFFVNASSGNVGIGTSSSNSTLHVLNPTANPLVTFERPGMSTVTFGNVGSIWTWASSAASANHFAFAPAGIETVKIWNGGNVTITGRVGIGTTSPGAKLDVNGTLLVNQSGSVGLFANGTNVGVGTTGPSTKLSVIDNTVVSAGYGVPYAGFGPETIGGSLRTGGIALYGSVSSADRSWAIWNDANSNLLKFEYSGARGTFGSGITGMVINSTGSVGIGTMSPTTKLDVNGSLNITDSGGRIRTPELCLTSDSCRTTWPAGGGSGTNYWAISGSWMNPNVTAGGLNNVNVTNFNATTINATTIYVMALTLGWGNLTDYNLNVGWTGELGFGNLTGYPTACSAGNAITALADSPTCSPFQTGSELTNTTEEMQDAVGGAFDLTLNYTDASDKMGLNRTWIYDLNKPWTSTMGGGNLTDTSVTSAKLMTGTLNWNNISSRDLNIAWSGTLGGGNITSTTNVTASGIIISGTGNGTYWNGSCTITAGPTSKISLC